MSNSLMEFDPATGEPKPYPSEPSQYRNYHGQTAWLFNPYTGKARDARDVGSDTFGFLISNVAKDNKPCRVSLADIVFKAFEESNCRPSPKSKSKDHSKAFRSGGVIGEKVYAHFIGPKSQTPVEIKGTHIGFSTKGLKHIGTVTPEGAVWFGANPNNFPNGTEFYVKERD